jgi:hypothetical protein
MRNLRLLTPIPTRVEIGVVGGDVFVFVFVVAVDGPLEGGLQVLGVIHGETRLFWPLGRQLGLLVGSGVFGC